VVTNKMLIFDLSKNKQTMKNTFFIVIALLTLASCGNPEFAVQIVETGQKVKVEIESGLYNVGDTIMIAKSRRYWYIKSEFHNFNSTSKTDCITLADSTLHCWTDYKAIILP